MNTSFEKSPLNKSLKRSFFDHTHINAAIIIQRAVKRWIDRNKIHKMRRISLLNSSIQDKNEKLRDYKIQQQQIEFENLQAKREESIDLSIVKDHDMIISKVIPLPLPDLVTLKEILPLNCFQSIGKNNFIITLNDKNSEIFQAISSTFRRDNPVSPGKIVHIHQIRIVWNHQHQDRFLRLEKHYRDHDISNLNTAIVSRDANSASPSHEDDPSNRSIEASTTSQLQEEIFDPYSSLQDFYMNNLKNKLVGGEGRAPNIVSSWFVVESEIEQEHIAKHGIQLKDSDNIFDTKTHLTKLFGHGLYFQLQRNDFDEVLRKQRVDRERKEGSTSQKMYNTYQTPIKKVLRDSKNTSMQTPRTPRTPRTSQTPITLAGCYLLPGKVYPSTSVRLGGTSVKGYDSTYSIVRNKSPNATFCSSYTDFSALKDLGPQLFPIESETETPDSDEIVMFDERAILPLFYVTVTVEKDVRRTIEPIIVNRKKKLKQILLSKDKTITEMDEIKVENVDSIADAIERGEKIIVLPGVYEGDEFMLSKSQIVKGSSKEHCIFSLKGHIVVYNTISNITIRCHDPKLAGSLNIYLLGDTTVLKNCIIDGVNIVVGDGQDEQILSSCIIQGDASIEVSHSSTLTIQKSRVMCTSGINVKDNATCHLVGVGMERSSVSVQGQGRLLCNQNTIFKQSDYAIIATALTDITLDKVIFKEIKTFGICSLGECELNLSDCSFLNCNGVCLLMKDWTLAKVTASTFRQCQIAFDCATSEEVDESIDGAVFISNNAFIDTQTCVRIRSGKPKIHSNKFVKCTRSITCGGHSSCDFRDNVLHNAPFESTSKSQPLIKNNQFTSDLQNISSIICSHLSSPKIKRNTFGSPKGNCIYIRQSSRPLIQSNNFLNSSIAIHASLNPTSSTTSIIIKNSFRRCKLGIKVVNDSVEEIVTSSDKTPFTVLLEGNQFVENDGAIQLGGNVNMKTRRNSYHSCVSCIAVDDYSKINIKESSFVDIRENAIITFKKAHAFVQRNEFTESKCRSYCVRSRGESQMELLQNEFYSVNGVHAKEKSSMTLIENVFYVNEHAVTVGNNATARFTKNIFKPFLQKTLLSSASKLDTVDTYSDELSLHSDEDEFETITELSNTDTPLDAHKIIPFMKSLNMNCMTSDYSPDFVDSLCIEAVDAATIVVEENTFTGESVLPNALLITGESRAELKDNTFVNFLTWVLEISGSSDSYIHKNIFNTKFAFHVKDAMSRTRVILNEFTNGSSMIWMQTSGEMCEIDSNEFSNCELPIKCSGSGTISRNVFKSYSKAGIQFNNKSPAICKENIFSSEGGSGILIEEDAMPHVAKNTFTNQRVSVEMVGSSDTVFHENAVTSGIGLLLSQNAKCSIVGNSFNAMTSAIEEHDFTSASITNNTFMNCVSCIMMKSQASLKEDSQFTQSYITSNQFNYCRFAVDCGMHSCAVITKNRFRSTNGNSSLVTLRDHSRTKVSENHFSECETAISVLGHSYTEILYNNMENLVGVGCIFCMETPVMNIFSQNILTNCKIGLSIFGKSYLISKENTIKKSKTAGIIARGLSQTMIDDTTISEASIGILAKAASLINVWNTTLEACAIGVRTSDISGLSIHDSSLKECDFGTISENESQFILYQVSLQKMRVSGLFLTDNSNCIISGPDFIDNCQGCYAIYADKFATGRVIGNSADPYTEVDSPFFSVPSIFSGVCELDIEKLEEQSHFTEKLLKRNRSMEKLDSIFEQTKQIVIRPDSLEANRNQFLVRSNLISSHKNGLFSGFNTCIVLSDASRIELRALNIERCTIGVLLTDFADTLLSESYISRCNCAVAVTTTNQNTLILSNHIKKNKVGIALGKLAQCTVKKNKITRNTTGIMTQGKCLITRNKLERNQRNIEIGSGLKPILLNNIDNSRTICGCLPSFFHFIPMHHVLNIIHIGYLLLPLLFFVYLLLGLVWRYDVFTPGTKSAYWFAVITGCATSFFDLLLLGIWNCGMLLRGRLRIDMVLLTLIIASFARNAICGSLVRVAGEYQSSKVFEVLLWIVPILQILGTIFGTMIVLTCVQYWCWKLLGFRLLWFLARRTKTLKIGDKEPLKNDFIDDEENGNDDNNEEDILRDAPRHTAHKLQIPPQISEPQISQAPISESFFPINKLGQEFNPIQTNHSPENVPIENHPMLESNAIDSENCSKIENDEILLRTRAISNARAQTDSLAQSNADSNLSSEQTSDMSFVSRKSFLEEDPDAELPTNCETSPFSLVDQPFGRGSSDIQGIVLPQVLSQSQSEHHSSPQSHHSLRVPSQSSIESQNSQNSTQDLEEDYDSESENLVDF